VKKIVLTLSTLLYLVTPGFTQTFVNGSFETTSGRCNVNEANEMFNFLMSGCFAFGNNSQLDILSNNCSYGTAQNGNYYVGIAVNYNNTRTDAFSLELTEPLTPGKTYMLSFYNRKSNGYDANVLEVGYSTDSISFGKTISKAGIPGSNWQRETFIFTPTTAASYITIRSIAGSYGWNHVDNFTISPVKGMDSSGQVILK
jgi:hypothetical protein